MNDLWRIQQVLAACHEETARRMLGDEPDVRFDPILDSLLDLGDVLTAQSDRLGDPTFSGSNGASGPENVPGAGPRGAS